MKSCLIAAWLATMWCVASWAGAETFPLKHMPLGESRAYWSSVRLTCQADRPDGVAAEPKYNVEPLYASFSFGVEGKKKPFVLVMDKSSADAPRYDVLYVDTDRDGDIGEEKPVKIEKDAKFEVTVACGGKPLEHRFAVRCFFRQPVRRGKRGPLVVLITNKGAWMGEITLAGERMNIMLRDVGCDGIYNKPLRPGEGARVVSRSGDGFRTETISKEGATGSATGHYYPAIVEAGGKFHDVSVAADGSSISFEPEAKPLVLEIVDP